MQIGRALRRAVSSPVRGLGRIARGNVRQGLRDLSPATKLAAAFVPGGALAAGAVGALGGAMGAGRGAGLGEVLGEAAKGAGTGMTGRSLRIGAQRGLGAARNMFTGGGAGVAGGARNLPMAQFPDIGGAGSAASLPPLPEGGLPVDFGSSPRGMGVMQGVTSGLSGAARQATAPTVESIAGGGGGGTFKRITGGLGEAASSLGQFSKDYPDLVGGIARGAGTAFAGAQQAGALERQIALQERQDERAATAEEEERQRRIRVAQMLAPLFQQMQQQQYFS